MTRENKVALVVGFALVLLAGVLISDHFSKARLDRPADLAVHQAAGMSLAPSMGELIDLSPYFRVDDAASPAPASSATDERPRLPAEPPLATESSSAAAAPAFQAPAPLPASAPPASSPAAPALATPVSPPFAATRPQLPPASPQTHEVQPGESLSVICDRYYHDQSLLDELARLNGIADPDDVRAGQRLRVPSLAELTGKAPASTVAAPPPNAAPPKAGAKTCTVQPGETLMQIAARHLGSRSRWRELFEANRDVIDDPDTVEAGTVLKLPGPKR